MNNKIVKYLYSCFAKLVEKYGFSKSTEINEGQTYSIEYCSDAFVINIEKYFREFYVILYKTGYSTNKGVNLFNLLSYLDQTSSDVPTSNPFREEKVLEEGYKKQLNYISAIIDENFAAINDFFKNGEYESKMADIRKFMVNKYPKLFKGWN